MCAAARHCQDRPSHNGAAVDGRMGAGVGRGWVSVWVSVLLSGPAWVWVGVVCGAVGVSKVWVVCVGLGVGLGIGSGRGSGLVGCFVGLVGSPWVGGWVEGCERANRRRRPWVGPGPGTPLPTPCPTRSAKSRWNPSSYGATSTPQSETRARCAILAKVEEGRRGMGSRRCVLNLRDPFFCLAAAPLPPRRRAVDLRRNCVRPASASCVSACDHVCNM